MFKFGADRIVFNLMLVMDFHSFLCQSTHVPNDMAVTFVKLMEFYWVDEFDDLGLVGILAELAPHGVEHHLGESA